MDIFIILLLVLLAFVYFKKTSHAVIAFGLIDIILRILHFIGENTTKEIGNFISKYLPSSIDALILSYAKDTLALILEWIYVLVMILFVYYVSRIIIKRR